MRSQRTQSRGFTLVEVLIALVILGIGSVVLVQLQTNMIRSNTIAKQRTDATLLAQNTIENFRSKVTSDIKNGSDTYQSDTTLFTRIWETSNLKSASGIDTGDIEIKVTISWPDISFTDESGNSVASESTTIYLSSIISRQSFSDSAIQLKLSKSPPVILVDPPAKENCPTKGNTKMGGHGHKENCSKSSKMGKM